MECLIALLTTLALHLPAMTGQPVQDMATLPTPVLAHRLPECPADVS